MNGKGDKPRNCLSEEFRNNYGEIDWSHTTAQHQQDNQVNKDIVIVDTLDIQEQLNN